MLNHVRQRQLEIRKGITNSIVKAEKNDFEKGGEGSKGGKVIGHTQSGKPIYSHQSASDYKNFSPQDHRDAAEEHHTIVSNKSGSVTVGGNKFGLNKGTRDHHSKIRNSHHEAAEASGIKKD